MLALGNIEWEAFDAKHAHQCCMCTGLRESHYLTSLPQHRLLRKQMLLNIARKTSKMCASDQNEAPMPIDEVVKMHKFLRAV